MATSKRVKKAAPLRQRFSLEVSSSKATPRASRPRTRMGRWTAILRSRRGLATDGLTGASVASPPTGHFPYLGTPYDGYSNPPA